MGEVTREVLIYPCSVATSGTLCNNICTLENMHFVKIEKNASDLTHMHDT